MASTTGTYTTGLKDEMGIDMGKMLIEKAYVTGLASVLSPAYLDPYGVKCQFAFKSGATTFNLDDVYVRNFDWGAGILLDWGANATYGQLGDLTVVPKSTPIQTVAGGIIWTDIACGTTHTYGRKADGTLWLWGRNSYGALGDNTVTNRSSPVQILGGATTWQKLAKGGSGGACRHSAAIKNDGSLWLWGENNNGQLGDNTSTRRSSPVQTVSGGTTWRDVALGTYTSSAIKSDGTLWSMGDNGLGMLGTGDFTKRSSPIQTVSGGTDWRQVNCGDTTTYAIKSNMTLWCWGWNFYGQLGDNTRTTRTSPVQTVTGGTWKMVAAGYGHAAGIKTDGTLWCWGRNNSGQLGNNTLTNVSSPVQTISGGTNWAYVGCGHSHTAAIKTDGSLWLWGKGTLGELGNNGSTSRSSPVQTSLGGSSWKKVAGGYHTVALTYNNLPTGSTTPIPNPPSSCWVARAVYGESSTDWVVFRDWLLGAAPSLLRWSYLKFGQRLAKHVENSTLLKFILRRLMDSVVKPRRQTSDQAYLEEQVRAFRSKNL